MLTKNDEWWANLTVNQKVRIATKARTTAHPELPIEPVLYPACSVWWNEQTEEQKQDVHDHCTDQHGYLLKEWTEGRTLCY